jgi:hypothetical protein
MSGDEKCSRGPRVEIILSRWHFPSLEILADSHHTRKQRGGFRLGNISCSRYIDMCVLPRNDVQSFAFRKCSLCPKVTRLAHEEELGVQARWNEFAMNDRRVLAITSRFLASLVLERKDSVIASFLCSTVNRSDNFASCRLGKGNYQSRD